MMMMMTKKKKKHLFAVLTPFFLIAKLGASTSSTTDTAGGAADTAAPATAAAAGATNNNDDVTNIIGGEPAPDGAYPFYAVANRDRASCGGTLIAPSWILTAAHCQDSFLTTGTNDKLFSKSSTVRIGVQNVTNLQDGLVVPIAAFIPHPYYQPRTHDIMLLRLAWPVNDIEPVALEQSSSTDTPADGENLVVMGFGHTSSPGGSFSPILLQVEVQKINGAVCQAQYPPGWVDETMHICAAAPGKDSCQGDSGGPLLLMEDDGPIIQTGIVSFGIGCASEDFPGVYTRVGNYAGWIQCVMDSGGKNGNGCVDQKKLFKGASSRRRLVSSSSSSNSTEKSNRVLQPDDVEYQAYLEACGDVEYDVSLYVDPSTHLYAIAVPRFQNDSTSTSTIIAHNNHCPAGAAVHAILSHNIDNQNTQQQQQQQPTKEIVLLSSNDDNDPISSLSLFHPDDLLSIGTFELHELARAYERAEPYSNNSNDDKNRRWTYDLLHNNCGHFMVNLARELNVPINRRITTFVTRRLLVHAGHRLVNQILLGQWQNGGASFFVRDQHNDKNVNKNHPQRRRLGNNNLGATTTTKQQQQQQRREEEEAPDHQEVVDWLVRTTVDS